ncbi:MAG: class I SAM-dependent methyltransferase [Sphingomicrobium sp.]
MTVRNDLVLRKYQRIARFYDLVDLPFELLRYRPIRPLLFRDLHGRLLDAGVGTGRNLPFYPPGSEVFSVDLSSAMLQRAVRRKNDAGATVHLVEMDLARLAFADNFFDAAVASFVFCTMPTGARIAALRELARVVRTDGRVRLLEYAPAQTAIRKVVARIWQPWVRWAFGANLQQDIEPELAEASLTLITSRYVSSSIKLIEAAPTK